MHNTIRKTPYKKGINLKVFQYEIKEIAMSKKKKKNKVIKLTDEQYGQYIMALKDETPPRIVSETQEKDN